MPVAMTREQAIEFLDGAVYSVGQRVMIDTDNIVGTILGFTATGRVVIQPDDETVLPRHMRWPLNDAHAERTGHSHWVEPRDRGVAGGNIIGFADAEIECLHCMKRFRTKAAHALHVTSIHDGYSY